MSNAPHQIFCQCLTSHVDWNLLFNRFLRKGTWDQYSLSSCILITSVPIIFWKSIFLEIKSFDLLSLSILNISLSFFWHRSCSWKYNENVTHVLFSSTLKGLFPWNLLILLTFVWCCLFQADGRRHEACSTSSSKPVVSGTVSWRRICCFLALGVWIWNVDPKLTLDGWVVTVLSSRMD